MKRTLLISLTVLAGCGPTSLSKVTIMVAGSGGALTSSDGLLTLTIPAGALSSATEISIGPPQIVPSDPQLIGRAYEIDPIGTPFAVEASLAIINRVRAGNLAIATVVDGQWVPLASQADSMQVTAGIDHLALCALVALRPGSGIGGAGGGVGGAGDGGGDGAAGAGGGDSGGVDGGGSAGGGAGQPLDAAGSGRDASDGSGLAGTDGAGVGGLGGGGGATAGGGGAGGAGNDGSAGSAGSSADGSLG